VKDEEEKYKEDKQGYFQEVKRLKRKMQERNNNYNVGMAALEIVQHMKDMNLIDDNGNPFHEM
jgi:hypothetical protein